MSARRYHQMAIIRTMIGLGAAPGGRYVRSSVIREAYAQEHPDPTGAKGIVQRLHWMWREDVLDRQETEDDLGHRTYEYILRDTPLYKRVRNQGA